MKQLAKANFQEFYKINEAVVKTTPMRKVHYNSSSLLEKLFWQKKRAIIKNWLAEIEYDSIIDIGCGDGGLLDLVKKDCCYTGLDISPTQIASFKKWLKNYHAPKKVKLVKGDGTQIPFSEGKFEVALACDVLEHVLNPRKAMKEIKRVIKKDGYVIISIPNEFFFQLVRLLTGKFPLRSPDHLYSLTVDDLRSYFPNIIKHAAVPFNLLSSLGLINIILAQK